MAVRPPLRDEQVLNLDGTVTQKFAEYLEAVDPEVTTITNTILGSADINGTLSKIAYLIAQSKTLYQLEVNSDYTVTGDFDLEIVT